MRLAWFAALSRRAAGRGGWPRWPPRQPWRRDHRVAGHLRPDPAPPPGPARWTLQVCSPRSPGTSSPFPRSQAARWSARPPPEPCWGPSPRPSRTRSSRGWQPPVTPGRSSLLPGSRLRWAHTFRPAAGQVLPAGPGPVGSSGPPGAPAHPCGNGDHHGLALSPDGSKLAASLCPSTGRLGPRFRSSRSRPGPGESGCGLAGLIGQISLAVGSSGSNSWEADNRTLLFEVTTRTRSGWTGQLRLLDTATPGGSLLASSTGIPVPSTDLGWQHTNASTASSGFRSSPATAPSSSPRSSSSCPAQSVWFHDHRVLGAHRKARTGPVPEADRHRGSATGRVLGEPTAPRSSSARGSVSRRSDTRPHSPRCPRAPSACSPIDCPTGKGPNRRPAGPSPQKGRLEQSRWRLAAARPAAAVDRASPRRRPVSVPRPPCRRWRRPACRRWCRLRRRTPP